MKNFQIGSIVKSKVNTIYKGFYVVTKVNKTTVWVRVKESIFSNDKNYYAEYKNVKKSILELTDQIVLTQ